jgi:hypothetical protein
MSSCHGIYTRTKAATTQILLQVDKMKPKPRRKKKGPVKSQQKCYIGQKPWTNEEKRAIQEGIQIFGKGQWAVIKNHFKKELADRTSGQIKDCHRTPAKSQQKCYIGQKSWTDEEKRAIQEGIKLFGKGRWSVINHYKKELADGTSSQIKDCHCTLEKHGKVLIIF